MERPALHRAVTELGENEALDPPARKLLDVAQGALKPGRLRDALSGTFLGHALHPLMTDLPIGSWTSALVLDAVGGRESRGAARKLVGTGILASLPTALTGAVEWADSAGRRASTRRIGLVHAAANVTALSFFSGSYLARRRGRSGRVTALMGGAALAVGGHLGGHLSYVNGEGVAVTTFESGPADWTPTVLATELVEGRPACAVAGDVPVLLVREGERIHALANRCNHRGGPLHEGEVRDGTITCPWHGSIFRLADGDLERGPAASPQPAFEARVQEGRVQVRQVTDPTP
ncbi:MAG TPA: Rieske 2Fe-2S domain-containing protein [Solirubrobacterales bacterium]|nr:Rieske 2Fe-2S domain-containing protein [Solirubrobacterales bacterium]